MLGGFWLVSRGNSCIGRYFCSLGGWIQDAYPDALLRQGEERRFDPILFAVRFNRKVCQCDVKDGQPPDEG